MTVEDEDDGTPLWKKALMRKRTAEQKKKERIARAMAPSRHMITSHVMSTGVAYPMWVTTAGSHVALISSSSNKA